MSDNAATAPADPVARWEALAQASASVTVAICCCQRVAVPAAIVDRLLEAKRDLDKLRREDR